MIKAVLFDLDGTLTDSLADIAASANAALSMFGWPTHTVDEYRQMVGDGADRLLVRAAPERAVVPGTFAQLRSAYIDTYRANLTNRTRPYPGIPEALAVLKARCLSLCVVSNKPDALTKRTVSHYFGWDTFDIAAGAREGFPLKPNPALALSVLAGLGAAPGEAVFVGDSRVDIETARAAGMPSIGAAWGFRGREELEVAGAGRIAGSAEEMAEIIVSLSGAQ